MISESRFAPAKNLSLAMALVASASTGCAGQLDATEGDPNTTSSAALVFEDALSPTERFLVYRYSDGTIAFSVQAKIGVDDHLSVERKLDARSLAASYRRLRPEVTAVPAILTEIDEKIKAFGEPPLVPVTPLETPKDYSTWYSTECHVFQPSAQEFYTPV